VGKPDSTDDDVTNGVTNDAAEELTDELDDDAAEEAGDEAESDDSDDASQSTESALFWAETEVDPVEIAFVGGTGLTLRHYRTVEDDDGDETEEAVFLAHRGKLHLFRSAEGLIEFINSDAPHDLTEIETWPQVLRRAKASDIVADEDDRYELDLVVENLRGGHDVWEPDLLVPAGEVARDIAFSCDLDEVLATLAPGSPLDDLDEGLRSGGFFARRRLKKIGAEQAAIAWRGVIGKLSAAVEWHD
jgi:hypothetical protein